MGISLYDHQRAALEKIHNGSILCGGVGSGKSRTALAYYFLKIANGQIEINGEGTYVEPNGIPLYIITTARKRDTAEWEHECAPFLLDSVVVDSWQNINKYTEIQNAFFIFDEQRVVSYGSWSKAFIKISKHNQWILLTATPGDTWMDYMPVFIANGFYKNKADFTRQHVIYSRYSKYPKVDKYLNTGKLIRERNAITVNMKYQKKTIQHVENISCNFDPNLYKTIWIDRWNPYTHEPIKNITDLCYTARRCANSDPSRLYNLKSIIMDHPKIIVFYNFNYELDLLRDFGQKLGISVGEWNGHKHEPIPSTKWWMYLVNYTAGAEGWNCIETNTIVFYSQNYSYKTMVQAAGRIDRLNTPFTDLYYFHFRSKAPIDLGIAASLKRKKKFNEKEFISA